jgi:hypothetical protein
MDLDRSSEADASTSNPEVAKATYTLLPARRSTTSKRDSVVGEPELSDGDTWLDLPAGTGVSSTSFRAAKAQPLIVMMPVGEVRCRNCGHPTPNLGNFPPAHMSGSFPMTLDTSPGSSGPSGLLSPGRSTTPGSLSPPETPTQRWPSAAATWCSGGGRGLESGHHRQQR